MEIGECLADLQLLGVVRKTRSILFVELNLSSGFHIFDGSFIAYSQTIQFREMLFYLIPVLLFH